VLGSPPEGIEVGAEELRLGEELRYPLNDVRRVKDPVELVRMRDAALATAAGFAAAVPVLVEGVSEREVQIELEAAAFRNGGDAMAYDTIVASGPNAAVLHYPPSRRRFGAGELVLIDAGAGCRGYASDITRTYPVGGRLSPEQRELHTVVHTAQLLAIEHCRPGTEWREVHRAASRTIAEGLAAFGVLRGRTEDLVDSGAVALFFPHGIGHLVGLGVRDAHGPLRERRDDPPPFPNLRIDLPLRAGMVVTVEPGVYFVPAILGDADNRRRHRQQVAWERVDSLLGFGGIRIEDNVLVGDGGYELLTADVPLLS
jgi:Xaa-Pro aminopeptidase